MPAVALPRGDLPFPCSLPEFQKLFPDDTACAAYLEAIRCPSEFVCVWCGEPSEPYRMKNRPHVLVCRKCKKDNRLMAGTVMQDSKTPLSIWFWAAYLVSTHTPGISAVQFQRQLGINRYETAFQILHKLRAGMVRPGRDRIGGNPRDHVEIDESWVGGRTRGEAAVSMIKASLSRLSKSASANPRTSRACRGATDGMPAVFAWKSCRIVRQRRSAGLSRRRLSPQSWS